MYNIPGVGSRVCCAQELQEDYNFMNLFESVQPGIWIFI